MTENSGVAMITCRLCGEEKSPLDVNVELTDLTASNLSYFELIEFHSRIVLKTNKLLPQGICEECRVQLDGFAEFSRKLEAVQSIFDVAADEIAIQDCDLPEDSIVHEDVMGKQLVAYEDNDRLGSEAEANELTDVRVRPIYLEKTISLKFNF